MILDMIKGCRYLRRSTYRLFLSKNSTTRLKDSKVWRKAGLLWNYSMSITNPKGSYLYPCPNMTPNGLRVQHLILKSMLWCQYLSCTCHQFVSSLNPGHVITHSRKLSFKSANSPSAEWWHIADRKHPYRILWGDFSCRMIFHYQTLPTTQSFLCTNFWC
jgi:hypothetical protein